MKGTCSISKLSSLVGWPCCICLPHSCTLSRTNTFRMSPLLHSATATAAAVRGLEAVSLVSVRGLSYAGGRVPARTQNIIGGRRVESSADTWLEVRNPATAELVTQVPQSTHAEMEEAVASAKAAFRSTGVSGSVFPAKLGQPPL